MTNIYFTEEQIATIRGFLQRGPNAEGDYSDAYSAIADMLPEGQVKLWFQGAALANGGSGVFSEVIRKYSQKQMELRGIAYSDQLMQAASNQVAINALTDILNPLRDQGNGQWLAPTIEDIANNDATGVGQILFASLGDDSAGGVTNAAWSGTVLFSALGSDQSYRLTANGGAGLNTLDDVKNVLFAFESYSFAYQEAIDYVLDADAIDIQVFVETVGVAWDTFRTASIDDLRSLAFDKISSLLSGEAQLLGELISEAGPSAVLDWIKSTVQGSYQVPTTPGDFSSAAVAFFTGVGDSLTNSSVTLLGNKPDIVTLANSSEAARNALMAFSPIVVQLSSYSHDLSLFDENTGEGALSEKWIDTRASFLVFERLYRKTGQTDGVFEMPLGFPAPILGDVEFRDYSSGSEYKLEVDGVDVGLVEKRYFLYGGNGSDSFQGHEGDDYLFGMEGADVLLGGDGDDYLEGGKGADTIDGGADDDEIDAGLGDDVVFGGAGKDRIHGGAGNDLIYGETAGQSGDNAEDRLYGDKGDDEIYGASGRTLLEGGEGADRLEGGDGHDLYSADDSDTIMDSDGAGTVNLEGIGTLTGGSRKESDPENEYRRGNTFYVLNGTTLTINGGLTIEQFENGDLGIFLETEDEEEEEEKPDMGPAESRVSPLTIDLNGDGVSTSAYSVDRYFDHDGNGMMESTAWVDTNDGLLVRDLNGNGLIDDGGELFGNNTRLTDGSRAANGFVALGELDENEDGLVDELDGAFTSLRIWRDANGNGLTEAGELSTLAEAGVSAFRTEWATSSFVDANDQAHRQVGSAISVSGSDIAVSDVWYTTDASRRLNRVEVPIEALFDVQTLPDAKAFGNLLDLRQAAAMDVSLRSLMEAYVGQQDSPQRNSLLKDIIFQWAGVAGIVPNSRGSYVDARELAVVEMVSGRPYTNQHTPNNPNPRPQAGNLLTSEFNKFLQYVGAQIEAQTLYADSAIFRGGFASGYNHAIFDWDAFEQYMIAAHDEPNVEKITDLVKLSTALALYSPSLRAQLESAYVDLVAERPGIATLLDVINSANGTSGSDVLYGTGGKDAVNGLAGDDTLYGHSGDDVYIYRPGDGNDRIFDSSGSDQIYFMDGILPEQLSLTRDVSSIIIHVNVNGVSGEIRINNVFEGTEGALREGVIEQFRFENGTTWDLNQILAAIVQQATAGSDGLYGSSVDEILSGLDGDDEIASYGGNDVLNGDGGNDTLLGGTGEDTLNGGAGNDSLQGEAGNDALEGGVGNDTLVGGAGSDTYLFSLGDGQDTISNYDKSVGRLDVLRFGDGIDPAMVTARRFNNDLVLTIAGTEDRVTVSNYFSSDAAGGYQLDEIRFEGVGTPVWDVNTVKSLVQVSTSSADTLYGYETADSLDGGEGNDTLHGYGGDDTLQGRDGDDTLYGGVGNDLMDGGVGTDVLRGEAGDDVLDGGADNDTLLGGVGNDQLVGGLGDDRLEGGDGDDRYYFARGDGKDTINDIGGHSTIYVSNLPLSEVYFRRDGTSLVIRFTSSADDEIRLEQFFDPATGLALSGIRIDPGSGQPWEISPADLDLEVLKATPSDDVILGNALDNVVDGLTGNDTVRGYDGADQLAGGDGDDELYGDSGNDILMGGAGIDLLDGGTGDDQLDGGDGDDNLSGGAGVDSLTGGLGADVLAGGADADDLDGGAGNDTLDGGAGADQLAGGADDDIYIVDDVGDVVVELANGGADTIRSSVSYTAVANVETLELTGTAHIDATGDAVGNRLIGNQGDNRLDGLAGDDILEGHSGQDELIGGSGNDQLDGGYGIDHMTGGVGDDVYVVDHQDDVVIEIAGEGADGVLARSDYTLSENIESLTLEEGHGAYSGTGNASDNLIVGNSSSNRLDGAAGADRMEGAAGDDTYVVDNAGDDVVELAGEGEDTVESSISYTLGATLENVTLTGTADLHGTGNDGDNVLIGNAGDNRLDGGLGGDDMHGGAGNDTFVNDSSGDWIYEDEGDGIDTIERRYETNLVLSDNVENLILADGITTGNGNELNNTITGNTGANTLGGWDGNDVIHGLAGDDALFGGTGSDQVFGGVGNDYLDGGAGIDQLEGGAGDDTYIVDETSDVVVEASGAGDDKVQTTASYTLTANVETLFLQGSAAINGTGNALDNYMAGNGAANALIGGGGSDTIAGGGGNDTLVGGTGDDKYVVNDGTGSDVIDNSDGGFDGVFFTNGITRDDLLFTREGDDLLITVDGETTPAVRVQNHFLGGDAAIDYVQPDGGYYLTTAEINQIVAGGGTGEYDQVIEGTAAGEQLVGSAGKDLMKGLAGDDQLFGMGGDDTLQGGDGNDYLAGGNGSGSGSGADRLEGGAGNDTLAGEDGDDVLIGGAGDDDYVYGGGQDTIDNSDGGYDGVFFNDGIDASRLGFSRDGDDLMITVDDDPGSTVRVSDHFLGGDAAIDYVQPDGGAMLDTAAINALADGGGGGDPGGPGDDDDYPNVVEGTSSGEQLLGSNGRDLMRGLGGGDTMFAFQGDDKLEGGDGNDDLYGGNGSFSGSGNDILLGGAGSDSLKGEDGDDFLMGGAGDDNYYYNASSGRDTIDNSGGGTDYIYLASIARERLSFHRDGDDLLVRVDGDTGKEVRVLKHFQGGGYAIAFVQPGDGGYAIPASEFDDLLTPMSMGPTPMLMSGKQPAAHAEHTGAMSTGGALQASMAHGDTRVDFGGGQMAYRLRGSRLMGMGGNTPTILCHRDTNELAYLHDEIGLSPHDFRYRELGHGGSGLGWRKPALATGGAALRRMISRGGVDTNSNHAGSSGTTSEPHDTFANPSSEYVLSEGTIQRHLSTLNIARPGAADDRSQSNRELDMLVDAMGTRPPGAVVASETDPTGHACLGRELGWSAIHRHRIHGSEHYWVVQL